MDDGGAFVERFETAGRADGPLSGLRFAAKDLFDVEGRVTGGGNPDWARMQAPAEAHAWAVARLLEAGATLIGKTVTDEVSLGLLGENAFDGTPVNPRAPGRAPGGSSSGSASAVAQGLCEIALGTDTGGSVRTPASFCGLYGIRPTHGRLPLQGMMAQAPSSDTTGWFADDADIFAGVCAAMFGEGPGGALPAKVLIAEDVFALAAPEVRAALLPKARALAALIGETREGPLSPSGLPAWAQAQRNLQMAEAWETFRPWVEAETPRFSYLVARTLMFASAVPAAELPTARLIRDEARGRLAALTETAVIVMPTTPDPAPPAGAPLADKDRARDRINANCAVGGLAGHPQVSLPLGEVDGLPVGLSVIGARGADMSLAALAMRAKEAGL
ncbi:MAG: amidase [Pseudomonadota bacterium]